MEVITNKVEQYQTENFNASNINLGNQELGSELTSQASENSETHDQVTENQETQNQETQNQATKTIVSDTMDNVMKKINGEDKKRVEPPFSKLLYQFRNKLFIKPNNLQMSKYELTIVENASEINSFQIMAIPKYSYNSTNKNYLLMELPEIQLCRSAMPGRKFLEKFGGSMNSLTLILNKKNREHEELIKYLKNIDDYNKNNIFCSNKKEYSSLIKPCKYNPNFDDSNPEDNFVVKMSFYINNKLVQTKITKTHEEDPEVAEEIEGMTIEQLASLLNSNVKVSIVCAIPYIWSARFDSEDPEKIKSSYGTTIKIVAIDIIVPYTPSTVGHGKRKNIVTKKVNYSTQFGNSTITSRASSRGAQNIRDVTINNRNRYDSNRFRFYFGIQTWIIIGLVFLLLSTLLSLLIKA